MLLITDPHNSLLERESFFACVDVWNKIWFSRKAAIEFCSVQRLQNITFIEDVKEKTEIYWSDE